MKQLYTARVLRLLLLFIAAVFGSNLSTKAQSSCDWEQGDYVTYGQDGWDSGDGAVWLSTNFVSVYGAQLTIGNAFTISFTNPAAAFSYMPASGITSVLTASYVNPLTTSSGELGGQVLALQLNVDFSDETGSQTTPFGDLVITDFTAVPSVNGWTVRQFLTSANNVLGGGNDAFSVGTAQVVASLLNNAFLNGTPSQFAIDYLTDPNCNPAPTCDWQQGQITTYNQNQWGDNASPAGALLISTINTIYPNNLTVGSTHTLTLTNANAVFQLLPSFASAGVLTANLQDPITTSAGELAGEVIALKLNVDFSDANAIVNSVSFGDLVISDFTTLPQLNGQTIREFLNTAEFILGGGIGATVSASTASLVASLLNDAFVNGTPSQFAIDHLTDPNCNPTPPTCDLEQGDFITYNQSTWETEGATLLTSNFSALYNGGLTVGSTNTITFTNATAVATYLPSAGSPNSLSTSLINPMTTSSGELGGQIVALKLNVDLNDAGALVGSESSLFGDLVIHDFSQVPSINGWTIREFLTAANTLLGGGSSTLTLSNALAVASLLNNSFENGTPSQFAIDHLSKPGCIDTTDCPTTNPISITTEVNVAGGFYFEDDDQLTGWTYAIAQNAVHGTAQMDGATFGSYDPPFGFSGFDFFVYSVTNGTCTVYDTVFVNVECATVSDWNDFEFVTFTQSSYGNPASAAATLLDAQFHSLYPNGLVVGGTNSITLTSPTAVYNLLPAVVNPTGNISGNLIDPVTTPAGLFAGELVALQLNVDISDAAVSGGTSTVPLGDLVLHNVTFDGSPFPQVVGYSVRQFLALMNAQLGDGVASISPAVTSLVATVINAAFTDGTPNNFANASLLLPCNDGNACPVTNPLTVTTTSNPQTNFSITASDADDDPLVYSIVQAPEHGTLVGSADSLVYTRDASFTGVDFFVYAVQDAHCIVTDTVFINVECPSIAVAGLVTYTQSNWGDGSSDAGILLLNQFSNVFGGTLQVGGTHIIVFTSSSAVFNYLPEIGIAGQLSASVQNPLSTSARELAGEVVALQINVQMSDSGALPGAVPLGDLVFHDFTDLPELNGQTVRQFLSTANFILGGGGNVGSIGPSTAAAVARRINGAFVNGNPSDFALESLMIPCDTTTTPTNNCPVTNPLTVSTSFNTPVEVQLNAVDPDNDPLTFNFNVYPTHGVISISQNALVTYTPNNGFSGQDFFTFVVSDGTCEIEDTVYITVECPSIADLGIVTHTQAGWGSSTTDAGVLLTANFNSQYPNDFVVGGNHTLTLSLAASVFTLLPTIGAPASLSGDVIDPQTTSAGDLAGEIVALKLNIDFSDAGILPGTMPFGDLIIQNIVSQPVLNGLTVREFFNHAQYVLGGGSNPLFSITTANNMAILLNASFALGVPSTFALDFLTAPCDTTTTPTNNCPVTNPITAITPANTPVEIQLDAADPDNDPLTFNFNVYPTHGTISISQNALVTYTPDDGFTGQDFFTFIVSDGTCEVEDTVYIIVEPAPNNCPVSTSSSVTVSKGTSANIELQATDADNDPLTYSISQPPSNGTATIANNVVTYTPNATFVGPDYFMFLVSDGTCNVEDTVFITVVVCPNGLGYWKNNQNAWNLSWTPMTLGTVSYNKQKLVQILNKPVGNGNGNNNGNANGNGNGNGNNNGNGNGADASLILAKQLIAAKLNILNGVVAPQSVLDCIAAADALLTSQIPMNVQPNTALGQQMVNVAACLEQFNLGYLTPGCTTAMREDNEPTAQSVGDLIVETIAPNPFTTSTIINYQLPYETNVTIDVYNAIGQHVTTLVNATQSGSQSLQLDATHLPAGVYHCHFRAGEFVTTQKLVLAK